jgi:hypothetical protein
MQFVEDKTKKKTSIQKDIKRRRRDTQDEIKKNRKEKQIKIYIQIEKKKN